MKTAALYLRSSKDRADASPAAQRRALAELAAARGLTVVAEFADAVESGKDDNRPAFQKLLAAVRNPRRGWDTLLVLDTARIARRRLLAVIFEEQECRKHGVSIIYKSLPESDPVTDMVIKSIFQAFDEWHSLTSRMKGLAGMAENVKAGFRAGGRAPLGYQLEHTPTGAMREGEPVTKSKLVPGPKAPAVKEYLTLRAGGTPRAQAQRAAGLDDVATTTLLGLERNALTFAGHTVWNVHAERVDGAYVGGSKYRPRKDWVIQEDTHEALITTSQAEALLAALERSTRTGKRTRTETLLGGLLVTPAGARWHGDGSGYRVRHQDRWVTVAKSELEPALVDQVVADLTAPALLEKLTARVQRTLQALTQDSDVEARADEMAALGRQIDRMLDLASQTSEPGPMLRRVEGLEQKRAELLAAAAGDEERAEQAAALAAVSEKHVAAALRRIAAQVAEQPPEGLRETLGGLIEKVELDPETLAGSVFYRLPAGAGVTLASPRGTELNPSLALAASMPFRLRWHHRRPVRRPERVHGDRLPGRGGTP
ncbi:MAG TPA: recombinase family protein [Arenimonas sp.]